MLELIKAFWVDENGASAVEYGLIVGLIAVLLIAVLILLGGGLEGLFSEAGNAVVNAGS
jgi:pilus assembly protein Flp/PilA